MQKPKGFDEASREMFRSLPAGGYICEIKGLEERVSKNTGKPMIAVAVDIAEGEFKGHIKKSFENRLKTNPKAKYPNMGIAYCMCENDDGSTHPNFKNFIECVKESNPGFEPVWGDNFAAPFKNRKVGVVFCREQFRTDDGELRWSTKPDFGHFKSVSDIREGKYSVPDDKPLKDESKANTANSDYTIPEGFEVISEDDVPF